MIDLVFTGHLGKDGAQVKEGKNGTKYLQMDIATDIRSKGETRPMWVRVYSNDQKLISGKMIEYLTRGKPVKVTGVLAEPSAWISTTDGKPRAQTVVMANTINFATSGQRRQEGQNATERTPADALPFEAPAPEGKADDLPF